MAEGGGLLNHPSHANEQRSNSISIIGLSRFGMCPPQLDVPRNVPLAVNPRPGHGRLLFFECEMPARR